MAKIQRLKISTDEKMSMLRGQPGHMTPAPATVPEKMEWEEVALAERLLTDAEAADSAPSVAATASEQAAPGPVGLAAMAPGTISAASLAQQKRGRGRPPKSAADSVAAGSGLQPSLIRLEGETQRAALAYLHEELMRHSRRVYLKELVDEAVNYYLKHGPPSQGK